MEHRPIPGTLGFLADSLGNIYDQHMVKREIYRNGDGYITASVLTTDNEWVTFGVHRLVALAFHGLPKDGFDQVNHRDADITLNYPQNLEWVSAEQNNIHSEIFREDNHKPCIIGTNDEYPEYPSWYLNVWEAALKTGLNEFNVWDSIKNNKPIENDRDEFWQFSYQKYSDNIPKSLQKERIKNQGEGVGTLPKRSVKVRDIDSDIVFKFESIADAARYFNVGSSHIHQAIPQRDVVRVFKKKYQIAYQDQEFPELSEEDWQRAKNTGPRDVVAYCYSKNTIYIYDSATEFIKQSGLSKKAVTTALVKSRLRKIGDWSALYYEGDNLRDLLEFVKGSSPGVMITHF